MCQSAGTFNIQPTATFTADSVTVNFAQGTDLQVPLGLRVELQVQHQQVEQVPEPSLTLALLGGGAALGFGDFLKRQLNKQQKDKNKDKG